MIVKDQETLERLKTIRFYFTVEGVETPTCAFNAHNRASFFARCIDASNTLKPLGEVRVTLYGFGYGHIESLAELRLPCDMTTWYKAAALAWDQMFAYLQIRYGHNISV